MPGFFDDIIDSLQSDTETPVYTAKELKESQFGFTLPHFAQQYLFGATGLRIGVFYSISGIPQSCKSPLLFDLMGVVTASKDSGGLGGLGILYEMEGKISPTLLYSILSKYGQDALDHTKVIPAKTLNVAFNHFSKTLLKNYKAKGNYGVPVIVGLDSIGGSAVDDVVEKIEKEGAAGKGFYDKAHFMKYFCENAGALIGDFPMAIVCINQEKEKVQSNPFGPKPKEMMSVTGGVSQIYKDGCMIHASYDKLANGKPGKLVKLRTLKTSFSDDRDIKVVFSWNEAGANLDDAYDHKFNWAAATADVLANHTPVGSLRSICNVSVAGSGLVTCPTFGLESVTPEEFEAALMSEEHKDVREALYTYLKIEKLRPVEEYADYMKERQAKSKGKAKSEDTEAPASKPAKKSKAKASKPKPVIGSFEGPVDEEALPEGESVDEQQQQ